MSWAVVLGLGGSLLDGILCGGELDDERAMECCRKDADHCNLPEKMEKTHDCCKPNRSAKNPGSLEVTAGSGAAKLRLELGTVALAPSASPAMAEPALSRPVPAARGFPDLLPNRPPVTPLLI